MNAVFKYSIICIMLVGSAFGAEPTVTLPGKLEVRSGRIVKIAATTDCKFVKWAALTDDVDVVAFPPDGKSAIVVAIKRDKPYQAKIMAYGASGDVPTDGTICVLNVDGEPSPGPGPNPPPTPPDPPAPPVDTFVSELQKAFDAETDPNKSKQLASFVDFFREAANTVIGDASVDTTGKLFNVLSKAAVKLEIDGKLNKVQDLTQAELKKVIPIDPKTVLTRELRDKFKAVFIKIYSGLEKVKK